MLKLFFGTMTLLIVLLLFGIPLGLIILFKSVVNFIYAGKRVQPEGQDEDTQSENGDLLSPLPVSDVMLCPGNSWIKPVVNFGVLLKLEENKVSIAQLREHFSKCFLTEEEEVGRYEKFFSYLVVRGGYAFRATKKKINLEDHIYESSFPKEDSDGNEISIESYLVEWILSGYKKEKPCWEMNLISNEMPSKCQYLAFKIHHAMADGYSMLHILDKLTDNQSPYLVKDFKEGKFAQLKQILKGPMYLGKMQGLPPEQNPFRVTPSENHEWIISFTSFPLDKLKLIRKKFGVHMISVLMTILTGAMREFLLEQKLEEIPEFAKIGTTLPWPNHPARNEKAKNVHKLCNHWIGAVLKVPLKEPDPASRIKQIEAEYISYQNAGLDKFTKKVLMPFMSILPLSVVSRATAGDLGFSGGLTSLIGGDNYSLLGSKVEGIHPFLAIHDSNSFISLSCFTFSHSGKMEVTLQVHPSVIKNQQCLDNFCHKHTHKVFDEIVKQVNDNE